MVFTDTRFQISQPVNSDINTSSDCADSNTGSDQDPPCLRIVCYLA